MAIIDGVDTEALTLELPPERETAGRAVGASAGYGIAASFLGTIACIGAKPNDSSEMVQAVLYVAAAALGIVAWGKANQAANRIKDPENDFKWHATRTSTAALSLGMAIATGWVCQAAYFSGGFKRDVRPIPDGTKIVRYFQSHSNHSPQPH